MIIWIFRILFFISLPISIGFYAKNKAAIFIGFFIGVFLLLLEYFIEKYFTKNKDIKILDLSTLIDGRILDICETKFISGEFLVPRFIINHLHKLTESKDIMEKAKGRRGLDILSRLQEKKIISFKIIDLDIVENNDLSKKIILIAKKLKAYVVTVDFNLNKMGALENVIVLNINDLSIALKPVFLPGEDMIVFIMKEGKDRFQGVGYLDDGTMIVIEDGRDFIGKKTEVVVLSILQTSQGRIIFTRLKKN